MFLGHLEQGLLFHYLADWRPIQGHLGLQSQRGTRVGDVVAREDALQVTCVLGFNFVFDLQSVH